MAIPVGKPGWSAAQTEGTAVEVFDAISNIVTASSRQLRPTRHN
jgi:hypothetical protein